MICNMTYLTPEQQENVEDPVFRKNDPNTVAGENTPLMTGVTSTIDLEKLFFERKLIPLIYDFKRSSIRSEQVDI